MLKPLPRLTLPLLLTAALLTGTAPKAWAATAPAAKSAAAKTSTARRVGIAAVVNDDVVTISDVDNRVALYMLNAPGSPPPEIVAQMETKVLDKLIDEKLELQEAKGLGITVSEQQVQEAFATIAQQNHLSAEEFKSKLTSTGLNIDTLYDQIRAEIAWGQSARRKLRPQINVSENEINAEIEQLKKAPPPAAPAPAPAPVAAAPTGPLTTYIHLKQIVVPIAPQDPENLIQAKLARIAALSDEVKSCSAMDAHFKDFPAKGTGDMGRGKLSALPGPMRVVADKLAVGKLSKPIRAKNAILAIMICEKKDLPEGGPAAAAPQQPDTPPAEPAIDLSGENARDQVANKIGMRRMLQMQERYLRDLRASAFIEKRG